MSNVSKIDANDKPTWLAYNETTGLTEPVVVDPITNVLYVFNMGNSAPDPAPASLTRAISDGDSNPTQIGYNDTTGAIEAMRCGTNGALITKIIN